MAKTKAISSKGYGPGNLTRAQAEEIVEKIKQHLESARELLFILYEKEGWRALGYDSWVACVTTEFGKGQSHLYRELRAARVERIAEVPIGSTPESHIRAALEIYQDEEDAADIITEIYRVAGGSSVLSARDIRNFAAESWVLCNIRNTTICERMIDGEIGPVRAYKLGVDYENAAPEAKPVIERCTDPTLSNRLLMVHNARPELFREVAATLSIPLYTNVPIENATVRDLEAWLGIDNAERRAQYVEINRIFYRKRDDLRDKAIEQAWDVARIAVGSEALDVRQKAEDLMDTLHELKKLEESKDGQGI